MRNRRPALFTAIGLACLCTQPAHPQRPLTLQELLEWNADAVGGHKRLDQGGKAAIRKLKGE